MKRLLILLTTFYSWAQISTAQAYRPFLVDSAHWTIEEDYCVGGCDPANSPDRMDCYVSSIYTFKIDGDTIVGISVYKKLTQNIVTTVNTGGNGRCFWPYQNGVVTCDVVGLLWEDTMARKVYIRKINYITSSSWETQDSLFFDFSLQIGDTMKNLAFADTFYVVDSINYSGFNSGFGYYVQYPVKTWYLHCVQDSNNIYIANMKLYESIGSSVGFWGYQPAFEGVYATRLNSYCIGNDSTCRFVCSTPLGTASISPQQVSIAVYPNPAKDILTLDISNVTPYQDMRFVVSDILGQEVRSEIITKAKTEIDISAYQPGIYVWHLLSDKSIIQSGRVVHD